MALPPYVLMTLPPQYKELTPNLKLQTLVELRIQELETNFKNHIMKPVEQKLSKSISRATTVNISNNRVLIAMDTYRGRHFLRE
jgi:hypothetical protein